MKTIVATLFAFAILSAVSAYADVVVEKPELPKGYVNWPITFTASCKTSTAQVKIYGWVNGEDLGLPLSPRINKSARAVVRVDVNGKTEIFVHLFMPKVEGPSPPTFGDFYSKTKSGWMKFFVEDSYPNLAKEKIQEALNKIFERMGVTRGNSFDNTFDNMIVNCLGGSPKK